MTFENQKKEFFSQREKEDGYKIMQKATALINEIGRNFLNMDGGELADIQTKLIGYKFYLADYLTELSMDSERLKIEMKETRALMWDSVSEEIKARDGKVKNKEQVENIIITETANMQREQILFETLYNKYKLKISAINDVITAIVQRLAELKRQIEQSRMQ